MSDTTKWEIYYSIRDDISALLCTMGDLCDKYGITKEYDSLHNKLAKKLVEIDRLVRNDIVFIQKDINEQKIPKNP